MVVGDTAAVGDTADLAPDQGTTAVDFARLLHRRLRAVLAGADGVAEAAGAFIASAPDTA